MKIKCKAITEIDVSRVKCYLFARYWEDSDVSINDNEFVEVEEDGSNLPQSMLLDYSPEITSYKGFEGDKCFYMDINPETGHIDNWEEGYALNIHWKVVDQGIYEYINDKNEVILKLDCEYCPDYLAIEDSGYGDYIIMKVDKNGNILNWNKYDFIETFKNVMESQNED